MPQSTKKRKKNRKNSHVEKNTLSFSPQPATPDDPAYYSELGNKLDELLLDGMEALKRQGQYDDWILLTKMLISYRLFMDVLHFYNNTDIRACRYSESTKKCLGA